MTVIHMRCLFVALLAAAIVVAPAAHTAFLPAAKGNAAHEASHSHGGDAGWMACAGHRHGGQCAGPYFVALAVEEPAIMAAPATAEYDVAETIAVPRFDVVPHARGPPLD